MNMTAPIEQNADSTTGRMDHATIEQFGDAELLVGTVITAIVQFLIVAFVCFLIVKAYENWKGPEEEEDSGPSETELLTQIRDLLQNR